MGPFIAKTIQKIRVREAGLIFWDCFTINFQPIAMICTFLERGESYLTYNQSFIKIGPKLRDLWDIYRQKIQKSSSPIGFCLIFLDCFTINFQPIAMICTFLKGGSLYLTYNQSFIKIGPKLRDLWDNLLPKLFKKFESERLCLIFWDCFTIHFQPIAMICTFLERGESYLTYNQSFIKIGPKLRDLWDHLSPKTIQKKLRVREAFVSYFGIVFTINFQPIAMICTFLERGSLT